MPVVDPCLFLRKQLQAGSSSEPNHIWPLVVADGVGDPTEIYM